MTTSKVIKQFNSDPNAAKLTIFAAFFRCKRGSEMLTFGHAF